MPYLQLDLSASYGYEVKRDLARILGKIYAEIMETTSDIVDVSFRELGDGNLWRCRENPVPSAVLTCDIRRGRPPEQRERLADALHGTCVAALKLDPINFIVEFMQHDGNETYGKIMFQGRLIGGLSQDWTPGEAEVSLIDRLKAARGFADA